MRGVDAATRAQVVPRVLPPEEAAQTFDEFMAPYTPEQAIAEARRALAAGFELTASREACPFRVDAPAFIARIAQGDFDAALSIIRQSHPFPSVFGRMCHVFCEHGTPTLDSIEGPAIRELERFVGDYGDPALSPLLPERPASGKRVAVIGAGSGGLAGAWMLRRLGHEVDIYDNHTVPGGMLITGYPPFRMARYGVRRENDPTSWGARFFGGTAVDRDTFERIVAEYDLVLVTIGFHHPYLVGMPGEDAEGVWSALDFIREASMGRIPRTIRRALVIGAGQTSLDASRSARRLGAEVTVCYRRTMRYAGIGHGGRDPTGEFRILDEEGIPYIFLVQPVRILADESNHVRGVEFVRTELGPPEDDGRPAAVPLPGTELTMECDTVIEAVGEGAELSLFPDWIEIADGKVVADKRTHRTSHLRVFAAGDITGDHANEGAALAAIQAAYTMDSILRDEPLVTFEPKRLRRGRQPG